MTKENTVQKKKGRIQVKIIIQKFVNSLKEIRDFFTRSILPYIFTILCVIILVIANIFILAYPQSITINDFASIFNLLISINISVFALSLTIYTLILKLTHGQTIAKYIVSDIEMKRISKIFFFSSKSKLVSSQNMSLGQFIRILVWRCICFSHLGHV